MPPDAPVASPRRVFLIGMMGCGKTTVGVRLAERLGWPYWDNDRRLHASTGEHVDELAGLGPEGLHALEAEQAVLAAREPAPLVAGLASSVVERTDLWPTLRAAGTHVYLRATVATLAARVGSGAGRPWLRPDPAGFIARTLQSRGHLYNRLADATVDVDDATPDRLAAQILECLPIDAWMAS
jgi:shikimate kinase